MMGIIAGTIFIKYTSGKAIPDYNEDIHSSVFKSQVKVFRDTMAVPHILSDNEEDLYRAVGYLQAQDRLWQMDLLRRLTQGRLSEIFGQEYVEIDQLFRALHFTEKSQIVLDSCNLHLNNIMQAYCEGVNAYMDDNYGKLPPEFAILGYKPEKWEAVHSVNLIGYMAWSLTLAWSTEVSLFNLSQTLDSAHFQELIPELALQDVYIIPDYKYGEAKFTSSFVEIGNQISELGLQVFQASNNWVVSGSKTASGKPILANDMHLELNAPGIWYQMQHTVPGKLNVTGVVLPGQPFIISGHNERTAWGMTNVMVDDMDFYLETLKEDDSLKYKFNGEWKDIKIEEEKILTKEGDTIIRVNQFTHRGPIVSGFKGVENSTLSMRWIGNEYSNELKSVWLFNRMSNIEEFKEAAKTFIAVSLNIAYADVDGNIGMYICSGVPIREGDGIFIVPGDTSRYDWKGRVPFEELPHEFNPESGFIASANNRSVPDDYPYYISRWYDLPNRQERIVEALQDNDSIQMEDMKAIQSDQKSKWAEKLVPWIQSMLEPHLEEMTEKEKQASRLLFSWDYHMDKESIESTIFEQFYFEFIRNIFKDEMGEDLYAQYINQNMLGEYVIDKFRRTNQSIWFDDITSSDITETSSDIAFLSLKDAVAALEKRLGEEMEDWKWGKVHTLSLNHPMGAVDALNSAFKLNRGPYPVGGSYHTVSPYSYSMKNLFHSAFGASHRHIYDLNEWNNSQVIIPTGISGIPASQHYCDQTEKYINYIYKTDLFDVTSLEENSYYRMNFMPIQE